MRRFLNFLLLSILPSIYDHSLFIAIVNAMLLFL